MAITKPYFLVVRPETTGAYACQYVRHAAYAKSPSNYTRAFMLIQSDLMTLFEYVEPSKKNLPTNSFRIMELLLRTCTELEANFKAILRANTYSKTEKDWNIEDYYRIEASHFLSQYEIRMPYWTGNGRIRKPFESWSSSHVLSWYQAYNKVKHDRVNNLEEANLGNLIDAVCGLAIVLAAQYWIYDFTPNNDVLVADDGDEFEGGIGGYLRVKFPENVPDDQRYDLNLQTLQSQQAFEDKKRPFVKYNYDAV